MRSCRIAAALVALVVAASVPAPSRAETDSDGLVLERALVVSDVGVRRRSPIHLDAVEARLVAGPWRRPVEGATVRLPSGETRAWKTVEADDGGWLRGEGLRGGWVSWQVERNAPLVGILDASGHTQAWIRGEPRAGDHYGTGWMSLPVALPSGRSELLFRVGRAGRLRARVRAPRGVAELHSHDPTVPNLVVGRPTDALAAVIVANVRDAVVSDLVVRSRLPGGAWVATPVPPIAPLATAQVGFALRGPAPVSPGPVVLELDLRRTTAAAPDPGLPVDRGELRLEAVAPDAVRSVTFRSRVDGSIQYYAVLPARPAADRDRRALVLTLHGAGVQGRSQARSYAPKGWAHVVAPTNRRPFGFDWEDWGRLDAMEVLDLATSSLGVDTSRVYLTGHSMGGHGTWQVGVQRPHRFAAIGPSAGWSSFASYGGAVVAEGDSPVAALMRRAGSPSDTVSLLPNLLDTGVYAIHGDADDNVPAEEARALLARLRELGHEDVRSWFQEGAGHWWDTSDEPGSDCVDWPPLFDFFARRAISPAPRRVRFRTASPGVAAEAHWARIEQQQVPLAVSSVDLRREPHGRRLEGETQNVAALSVALEAWTGEGDVSMVLDGQELVARAEAGGDRVWLRRDGDTWRTTPALSPGEKGPHRNGSFKEAFRHRPILVYGTRGSAAEDRRNLARARLDAETFRYRANGRLDVVADVDFDPWNEPDRNVVLHGNADTNATWEVLLGDSPVQVRRGRVIVGETTLRGHDLAVLFVRPRPGSDVATVGAVASTGAAGSRLSDGLPYFVSGIHYPDVYVVDSTTLTAGAAGIRLAGFFGNDWSLEAGELAWGTH